MLQKFAERFKQKINNSGNNNAQQETSARATSELENDSQYLAPPPNQDSSTIKTAAKIGAGVLAAVAVAATGGIAMPFIAPVSAPLLPVFYTAGSAVTAAAATGAGVAAAKKAEKIIEKRQAAKKLGGDEDQHLTKEVALADIGSDDLRPEVRAAVASSSTLPEINAILAVDPESTRIVAMANEDVNAAIEAVTIYFARCGLELTSSSSASSPTRGEQTKWYKENIDRGKSLFKEYFKAYYEHLPQDLAQVKTALLVMGLANVTSEECQIIKWSEKDKIKKALRSNDFYDAKTIIGVLYPDSQEQLGELISIVREGAEKLKLKFDEIMEGIEEMHKYAPVDHNAHYVTLPLGAVKQFDEYVKFADDHS